MLASKSLSRVLGVVAVMIIAVTIAAATDQTPKPIANTVQSAALNPLQAEFQIPGFSAPLGARPVSLAAGRTCRCSCGQPCTSNADCGPGGVCAPGITCCAKDPKTGAVSTACLAPVPQPPGKQ